MPTDRNLTRRASSVYAEVLLQAAAEAGRVFEVSGEIIQILSIIRGNVELRNTLSDRTIPGVSRASVVRAVFEGFDASLIEVLCVMVERDDIQLLARVCASYGELAEEQLGAVIIDVTTAVALDEELRALIKGKYAAQFGRDVLLREQVDRALVGGIVLSTHGRRIDASVLSQLENARDVLTRS